MPATFAVDRVHDGEYDLVFVTDDWCCIEVAEVFSGLELHPAATSKLTIKTGKILSMTGQSDNTNKASISTSADLGNAATPSAALAG